MGMHVTGVLLIGAYLVRVCLMDMNSYGHTSLWASIRERVSYGRVPLIRHVCQGHILHEHASQVTFLAQFSGRNQGMRRLVKGGAMISKEGSAMFSRTPP
jgi:hypothetical protein